MLVKEPVGEMNIRINHLQQQQQQSRIKYMSIMQRATSASQQQRPPHLAARIQFRRRGSRPRRLEGPGSMRTR